MASCLNVSQTSYNRFENDKKTIDYRMMEHVAMLFEMDITYLINYHHLVILDPVLPGGDRNDVFSKQFKLLHEKIRFLESEVSYYSVELESIHKKLTNR